MGTVLRRGHVPNRGHTHSTPPNLLSDRRRPAALGWQRRGYGGDFEATSQGELAQDVAHVVLGSFGGGEQLFGDLCVIHPLAHEIDHLPLPPADGRQRVPPTA